MPTCIFKISSIPNYRKVKTVVKYHCISIMFTPIKRIDVGEDVEKSKLLQLLVVFSITMTI